MFFKLSRMPGVRADEIHTALPVSHTCFNHVELPPYETEDQMRRGLLTAIHFGRAGFGFM